jgi:hypothetical protein
MIRLWGCHMLSDVQARVTCGLDETLEKIRQFYGLPESEREAAADAQTTPSA